MGGPSTLDPAATGDAGSAAVIAQLFETLTAFDDERRLQPALAESWRIDDDGRRIVFQLRPDLTFSDGTPLAGERRRPQLAAAHRSGGPIAARDAHVRRRRCARVPRRRDRSRTSACAPTTTPARSPSTWSARPPTSRRSSPVRRSRSCRRGSTSDPAVITPGRGLRGQRRLPAGRGDRDDDAVRGERAVLGGYPGARPASRPSPISTVAARSRRSRTGSSTTRRSAAPTLAGSPTTRRSARSSARSPRCRPTTTASTRRRPPFDDVRVRQAFARRGRLAAHRAPRPGRAGGSSPPRWSRRASPVGRSATSSRSTTPSVPGPCWPRPASRAARASPTSRS